MTETTNALITLDDVRHNPEVAVFVRKADHNLEVLGYTEHAERHATIVATTARNILLDLGRPPRTAELAAMAGYLHDVGNAISRFDHGNRRGADRARPAAPDGHAGRGVRRSHGGGRQPRGAVRRGHLRHRRGAHPGRQVRRQPRPGAQPDPTPSTSTTGSTWPRRTPPSRSNAAARTITLSLDIDTTVSQVNGVLRDLPLADADVPPGGGFLGCDFSLVINDTRLL